MRKPSASAVAIERALTAVADAMRTAVTKRPRASTWKADLDALRRSLGTLSNAARGGKVPEPSEPIGFTMEDSPQLVSVDETAFDEGGEHPDQGIESDLTPEHDVPGRDPRR